MFENEGQKGEERLPICFHGQHGQKCCSDRLSPVKVTKTKGWDEEKAERGFVYFPRNGDRKKESPEQLACSKTENKTGELGLEDGKEIEVHLPDFLLSTATVFRDRVSLVLLAETKWWELGAVV